MLAGIGKMQALYGRSILGNDANTSEYRKLSCHFILLAPFHVLFVLENGKPTRRMQRMNISLERSSGECRLFSTLKHKKKEVVPEAQVKQVIQNMHISKDRHLSGKETFKSVTLSSHSCFVILSLLFSCHSMYADSKHVRRYQPVHG